MSDHEHLWCTENRDSVTYTPGDELMTDPLVIRDCIHCGALRIERAVEGTFVVFVPEHPDAHLWSGTTHTIDPGFEVIARACGDVGFEDDNIAIGQPNDSKTYLVAVRNHEVHIPFYFAVPHEAIEMAPNPYKIVRGFVDSAKEQASEELIF